MRNLLTIFILCLLYPNFVFATTYYVKNTGNNNASGLNHGEAWQTLSKINSFSFKPGDDVYLLYSSSWKLQTLTIKWSGTNDNRVIIGAYYMNNGQETFGLPQGKNKPIIAGSYLGPCSGAKGSCINVPSAVPENAYNGLLTISGHYVTIQNIRIQNSAGRGISVSKKMTHVILEKNEIYYSAGNSSIFNWGSSYNIMRDNDTSYCAVAWKNGDWFVVNKRWPTCNSAVNSNNNIFENNYIHNSYGEGIVLLKNASNNIVRGNTLLAIRSANIYMDNSSNNIIENNMIIGDRDGEFSRVLLDDGHRYTGGISVKVEDYKASYSSVNNIIRNNLLVRSLGLLMGLEEGAKLAGLKVGVKFLNNTLVETGFYVHLVERNEFYEPSVIANNIFQGSGLLDGACKISPTSNIKLHHNHWSLLQSNAKCNNNIGTKIGDAQLNRINWGLVNSTNLPTINDFSLKETSPAINSAIKQTLSISMNIAQAGELTQNSNTPCAFDYTEASADYLCNPRGNTIDMGAINASSMLYLRGPMPPTEIKIN